MRLETRPRLSLTALVLTALALAAGVRPLAAADCNGNGIDDKADIASGAARDCDRNGVPDACDVETGLRPGSVALFRCDEGSGKALLDLSGKGNHGAISGVAFSDIRPFGVAGNFSLLFDHKFDAVTIAAGPGSGLDAFEALTLEAHVRPTTLEGIHYIIWADDDVYSLLLVNGDLRFMINRKAAVAVRAPPVNQWTHVAGTYDGRNARIYLNGKLAAQAPAALGKVGPLDARRIVRIGNDETATFGDFHRDFRGHIDQVRIVGRALSEEEIRLDAGRSLTPGAARDCNGNGVPDACDLASGTSRDADKNGIPDECRAPPASLETLSAARALRQASLQPARIEFGPGGTPRSLEARVPIPKNLPEDPVVRSLDFLGRFRGLYRLAEPGAQLFLKRTRLGETQHLFFGQHRDGIPVHGAELAVHLSGNEVIGTSGRWLAELPAAEEPRVSAEGALANVLESSIGRSLAPAGDPRLVWFNRGLLSGEEGAETRLAWRFHVTGTRLKDRIPTRFRVFADALDGRTLFTQDLLQADTPDKDFDVITVGNTTSITCWNMPWETADDDRYDADGPTGGYQPGNDPDADAAISLLHQVYDFFHAEFGRHAWDDDDGQVEVAVHFDSATAAPNAFYVSGCPDLRFTNGMVVADIFAHEYTHGIIDETSGLEYVFQSGALNESYADIFGAIFDPDWTIGEGSAGGTGRSLANPPMFGQPDHAANFVVLPESNDNGGVHTNSGIVNKAAFLIQDGGTHNGLTVRGIGRDKAMWLHYLVMTARLTSNAQLIDAANESIFTARLLARLPASLNLGFTTADVCSVINAFASVGLADPDLDCDGTQDSADADDDGDGFPDARDICPRVADPDQLDTDSDGLGDACDDDDDADGILDDGDASGVEGDNPCNGLLAFPVDCDDNCPRRANPDQLDLDGDGRGEVCGDQDGDRVVDAVDNCRLTPNRYQDDLDRDGEGDACDADDDDDGVADATDTCPRLAHADQSDLDGDGLGAPCDNCPLAANPDQRNSDEDGLGNACDDDDDGDGVLEDGDGSGVEGDRPCRGGAFQGCDDNCPGAFNPYQTDMDSNGRGLECDLAEQRRINGGRTFLEDLKDGVFEFRDPFRPFRIPIQPCTEDCPDWIPSDFETEVALELPFDLPARIVDDEGRVMATAGLGKEKVMAFRPRQDFFFRNPGRDEPGRPGGGQAGTAEPSYEGRRYYLEVFPTGEASEGKQYRISIAVDSREGPPAGGLQRPGDCNQDGGVDISDAICLLGHLFLGAPRTLPCGEGSAAGEANRMLIGFNGDAAVDISDAVALLGFLFGGGRPHFLGTECTPISGCATAVCR